MKQLFSIIICAIAAITLSAQTSAQTTNRQRLSREELAQKQAYHIANQMAFDDATTEKFVATYCDCQKEIWALGPRPKKSAEQQTDKETEAELKARFDHSQKILNIRQKYYTKYSEFLTQKQIKRVYELEQRMMKRLEKQHNGKTSKSSKKPR